ncbi:MAG: putative membrane protein YphA (DoxX/SURF4 family) [Pseudohongiellaceae bacterium]
MSEDNQDVSGAEQPRASTGGLWFVLVRWVLGATFLSMGAAKVSDPVTFLKLLREYDLVASDQSLILNGLAIILPWLEIWLGLLMVLGVAVRGSALTLLVMLLVFTGAIVLRAQSIMGVEGIPLCSVAFDCGCGSGVVNVCNKLAENTGLILLAAAASYSGNQRLCWRPRVIRREGSLGGR